MRILRVVAFLFLSSLAIAQTSTVSGHLQDPGSTSVSSRTFLRFELKNTGGQQCRVAGTTLLTPYVKDFTPNASGVLSATVYENSVITCGTSTGSTQWATTIWRDGKPQPSCFVQITTSTFNLDSASCLNSTATPVTVLPTDSVYARLDGSNAGWTGDQTFNSHNLSGINSLSASSATISGALVAKTSLKVCDANVYSGATWDAQITTAMADANCGIISAANLNISGASVATVSVPNNKQVWLPCGTFTGGASVDPVFQVNNFGGLIGRDRKCTFITTNSGTANIVAVNNGVNWWQITDMTIQSAVARTAGAGIRVQGGHGVIERVTVNPVFDGITFDTASVSGNNVVRDVEITELTGGAGSGAAWHCGIKNGGSSTGTISGNHFTHVTIGMVTAFTDAGFCIQDGSDDITIDGNSQAVANVGGSDSVGLHMELVNGGNQPTGTKVSGSAFEGGLTKEAVTVDSGLDTAFVGNTFQSSLRGMSINGGGDIKLTGNTFHLNQNEGLKINFNGGVTATGNAFSESSQAVTNVSSDIFVSAGDVNFALIGNIHKNMFASGKTCKDGIEIAAGGSDFFSISGDINNSNCTTANIANGATGVHQNQCNPSGPCSNGVPVGFTGDLSAGRTTGSGVVNFGNSSAFLDFGITTAGKFTLAGGPLDANFPLFSTGIAVPLTGTGACATITTQSGGSWAGQATCTGTTGASTLTITPAQNAPHGWVCSVQDQTTRANLFQQTATAAASCTLTATSITQNDVFVFSAIAF